GDAARADARWPLSRDPNPDPRPAGRAREAARADRGGAGQRRLGRAPPRGDGAPGRRDGGGADPDHPRPGALRRPPGRDGGLGLHGRADQVTAVMAGAGRRERKVVSVLFADLVGFTARTETLDPEDVEAILRPFHDRLPSELEQGGGTVEKFIGDAVMAVFGAPVAHEDDAERAVRAALAIRDWIREEEELEVRIAVNTGEVIGSLARGSERGLVAGDVVNTAFRLQEAAPVNGIIVGETTYNATSRAIEYREAPPVDAKGKAEPVPVWEVVQARSRYGADVTHKPGTPLVGRERELGLLVSTLARAQHERSPQLVTLVGVPGIGKSRLVYELFAEIDRRPELVYWRQGRCLPYGDGVAFWALGEIV